MCGFCIEYSAITLDPEDASELLSYFPTTIATVFRPHGSIASDIALQGWQQEPDPELRLVIAWVLWLRDNDDLFIQAASDPATTYSLEGHDNQNSGNLLSCNFQSDEDMQRWYERLGEALLINTAKNIHESSPLASAIPPLCLAVWAGYKFKQSEAWEGAVTAIAGEWARQGPPDWNPALWLRREARLALWLAGHQDTARELDHMDDYQPVMEWISRVGEAASRPL